MYSPALIVAAEVSIIEDPVPYSACTNETCQCPGVHTYASTQLEHSTLRSPLLRSILIEQHAMLMIMSNVVDTQSDTICSGLDFCNPKKLVSRCTGMIVDLRFYSLMNRGNDRKFAFPSLHNASEDGSYTACCRSSRAFQAEHSLS